MSANGFTPSIVVFACNWCSYAGADTTVGALLAPPLSMPGGAL